MAKDETAWEALEQSVEQLFRAAGYYVERGVEQNGFEFDIIATRAEFAGLRMRIAVECKHRADGTVTNTDIHSFKNAFQATKDDLNFTHAIVVTNHRFSRQAHEAVGKDERFRLLTYASLEDELLGAQSYLHSATRQYRSHVRNKFIDLSADIVHGDARGTVPRLVKHLASAIQDEDQLFALILGDFGTGKTNSSSIFVHWGTSTLSRHTSTLR